MEQLDPTLTPPDPDKAAKKRKQKAMLSRRRAPRSQEIGRILRKKRRNKDLSLLKCAERIGTSRQRYAAIEAGKSQIRLVELEELMRYFSIAPNEIWPDLGKGSQSQEQITELQVSVGQKVTIVVKGPDRYP
jgi:ribosome-binding protein aMBF1 (putative translation factor)